MNILKEISVRARWDGSFTGEWPTIRNSISLEGCLADTPGKNDIQKLKTWAEAQGLLMDFELASDSFSSEIRTVTFWNGGQAVGNGHARQAEATAELPTSAVGEVVSRSNAGQAGARVDYFDWDAVGCR